MTGRANLAACIEEVDRMNDAAFARSLATGLGVELLGADSKDGGANQGAAYRVKILNSINPSILPPHKLRLRKGMPIMLLRN